MLERTSHVLRTTRSAWGLVSCPQAEARGAARLGAGFRRPPLPVTGRACHARAAQERRA